MKWKTIEEYRCSKKELEPGPPVIVWSTPDYYDLAEGIEDKYGKVEFYDLYNGQLLKPTHWMNLPKSPEGK